MKLFWLTILTNIVVVVVGAWFTTYINREESGLEVTYNQIEISIPSGILDDTVTKKYPNLAVLVDKLQYRLKAEIYKIGIINSGMKKTEGLELVVPDGFAYFHAEDSIDNVASIPASGAIKLADLNPEGQTDLFVLSH